MSFIHHASPCGNIKNCILCLVCVIVKFDDFGESDQYDEKKRYQKNKNARTRHTLFAYELRDDLALDSADTAAW
uniref:Uncharacterized protein n=1 Tax=Anopheles quadriannulatus TaxID=34691 RepID=A0A182XE35_ANOQN